MSNLLTVMVPLTEGAEVANPLFSFIPLIAVFAFMYFFMIRPQRKKQKEVEAMRAALKVGDSVLTVGGFYGKIVEEVNNVFIIEFGTNKSVRVPLKRESVAAVEEPDLKIKVEDSSEQ